MGIKTCYVGLRLAITTANINDMTAVSINEYVTKDDHDIDDYNNEDDENVQVNDRERVDGGVCSVSHY